VSTINMSEAISQNRRKFLRKNSAHRCRVAPRRRSRECTIEPVGHSADSARDEHLIRPT
jgi:hypothetical protein